MDVSEVVEGKKSNVKILEKQDKKHFEQGVFYIKGKTRCELKEIETLADLVLSCLIKIDLIK